MHTAEELQWLAENILIGNDSTAKSANHLLVKKSEYFYCLACAVRWRRGYIGV